MNVENLQRLYRTGQRILRERLPFGFGAYDCGSFACFYGWYRREYRGACIAPTTELALSQPVAQRLFMRVNGPADRPGPAAYAELEKRMEYLAGLIREAGGSVPGEKSGLPDVVRQLFNVQEQAA